MTIDTATLDIESLLQRSREASRGMALLSPVQKAEALEAFARLVANNQDMLLAANQKDMDAQAGQISDSLYQRLKLDAGKIVQLVQGIRDVAGLADPVGRVDLRTQLDDGLTLERVSVPIGVIGIIFESRPDVIPQILSLILKSGNAVVLKGGREAAHSNAAFMALVDQLASDCPWLPPGWAQLLDSREAVQALLAYPQYVDLIIPRGSNELVQSIMANTKIPVMGHADGVCHLYVHSSADLAQAVPLAVDAKAQYPAACNALETLLVDETIAQPFLTAFADAAATAGITLRGDDATRNILPTAGEATDADWRTEYGDKTLAVKVVDGPDAAVTHINRYGSHHTDAILATDANVLEQFLNAVDSACVFANASTRFADGFRFGFGAEVGISTARTHARGPVGIEGLVIYKYKLRGDGHIVKDYTGADARPFQHKALS